MKGKAQGHAPSGINDTDITQKKKSRNPVWVSPMSLARISAFLMIIEGISCVIDETGIRFGDADQTSCSRRCSLALQPAFKRARSSWNGRG